MRWLLPLLLAGCVADATGDDRVIATYPDVADRLLTAWEAERGPAPACPDMLGSAVLIRLDEPLDRVCRDYRARGCLLPGGSSYYTDPPAAVIVRAGMGAGERDTVEHELTHLLLVCSGVAADGDPEHMDGVW